MGWSFASKVCRVVLVTIGVASTPVRAPRAAVPAACEDPAELVRQSGDLWRLWPTGHGAIWAAARNGYFVWNGCRWTAVRQPDDAPEFFATALWSTGPRDTFLAASFTERATAAPRVAGTAGKPSARSAATRDRLRSPGDVVSVLLRWDGRRWRELSRWDPSPFYVVGLWGTGPRDLWIAGRARTHGASPALVRWDGRSVRAASLPGLPEHEQITIFGGTSTRNAWLAAGARVLHWDGKIWSSLPPLNRPGWHTSTLWGERRDDLWALSSGANAVANGLPAALHFDGRVWQDVERPSSGTELKALGGAGGVLFARDDVGSILRWTGTAWSRLLWPSAAEKGHGATVMAEQHRSPNNWPHDLAVVGASSGLALGGTKALLAWDGRRWRASPSESATSVWESPAGEAWAGTAADWNDGDHPEGGLLRLRGDRWERVADSPAPLLRVAGAAGEVWAVGPGGTAVRCREEICAAVPTGTRDDLIALWAAGERVWAAGRRGTVLTWDGTRWQVRMGTRLQTLRAVWGSDDGHIVGVGPGAQRLGTDGFSVWDGKDWAGAGNPCQVAVATVVPDVLVRVAGRSRTDLWVIGTCTTPSWMFPGCPGKSARCPRGVIAHGDGRRWTVEKLFDVRDAAPAGLAVSASEVWVTTAHGLVLRRDRQGWTRMDLGTVGFVHTVVPSARGGLWIIADGDPTPRYVQPKPM